MANSRTPLLIIIDLDELKNINVRFGSVTYMSAFVHKRTVLLQFRQIYRMHQFTPPSGWIDASHTRKPHHNIHTMNMLGCFLVPGPKGPTYEIP